MNTRPISVSHLVFGLTFLGAAVLWAIGAATDADAPDMALLAPAVLIGAGVAGLIAVVVNARNARIAAAPALGEPATEDPTDNPTEDTEYADTAVLDQKEQ
jgi:hypothetical protein